MDLSFIREDDDECTAEELEVRTQKRMKNVAKVVVSPKGSAATAIKDLVPQSDFMVNIETLNLMNDRVKEGNLVFAEQMLVGQAQVLQSVFSQFTSRMAHSKYLDEIEAYAKIALRAQNQCNRTLKTLLEFKHPKRTTFIKQQNNAVNQ